MHPSQKDHQVAETRIQTSTYRHLTSSQLSHQPRSSQTIRSDHYQACHMQLFAVDTGTTLTLSTYQAAIM